jgi:outer membrane protein OmpA-like peptidoglycan-associated protein
MVEQLKAQPAPRTRGLRNLTVEAADTTPATRPSLSLLIQFDFNSAKVKPESQQALSNLAQALQSKELVDAKFAVEGHTDAKGRADYNLKLSQQRADAVRAFLANNGVADARLQAVGKGATELANATDPLAADNRRVRIVNLN